MVDRWQGEGSGGRKVTVDDVLCGEEEVPLSAGLDAASAMCHVSPEYRTLDTNMDEVADHARAESAAATCSEHQTKRKVSSASRAHQTAAAAGQLTGQGADR